MAVQVNIIKDLSSLTKVPSKAINELTSKEMLCMGSAIHDALLNNEEAVVMNIGFGTLSVELGTGKCKFVPSREFTSVIKKSIDEKIDPLELELNQNIIDKLMALCDGAI